MRGYIIPWLLASLSMYGLSYLWHGWFLNDLEKLQYPLPMFMGLALIVYLVIGAVMTWALDQIDLSKASLIKGFMVGSICGFVLYLVAFTLGVSFSAEGMEHVIVDFAWQMIEEGIGGALIAVALYIQQRNSEFAES